MLSPIKRAESALEDMADLFRVLMADNRDLVPLADEIALYASIYRCIAPRGLFGRIKSSAPDAMILPLIMQRLLKMRFIGIELLLTGK